MITYIISEKKLDNNILKVNADRLPLYLLGDFNIISFQNAFYAEH